MSLETPIQIRTLLRKLYLPAKWVRRHKVPSRGAGRFPDEQVFGVLGVLRLRSLHLSPLS